jgi:phosphotransferase system enzyme I (PtsI)
MKGIGVSPGIAIGRVLRVVRQKVATTGILLSGEEDILEEVDRYRTALDHSVAEIRSLITAQRSHISPKVLSGTAADILDTHVEMLMDPQLDSDILEKIRSERKTASDAIQEVVERLIETFRNMEDPYLSARAADVDDIGRRLLKHLGHNESSWMEKVTQPSPDLPLIIVADDLSPSDMITIDLHHITGFALGRGGSTSHAAIVARLRGIPAVVGCGSLLDKVLDNDLLGFDGATGQLWIDASDTQVMELKQRMVEQAENARLLATLRDVPAQTLDGRRISLHANISHVGDMKEAFLHGAEGVGLFRTEFLFMEKSEFPTEEEQFISYKDLALGSLDTPVTIRTLDIGGDKPLPYFPMHKEQNPFLGLRAIRISLDRSDLFITQLRAILRASAFGKLKILVPMVSNIEELRKAKELFTAVKNELLEKTISFDRHIPFGVMIEVPSAAIIADLLAREADFFSIGTNDLCQYTMAADRMNDKVNHLCDPFHPAVLRLINFVIQQAERNNIPVSLCGEMASDPLATLLLVGMGLQEFSMNAPSIPKIKHCIVNASMDKARKVLRQVMEFDDASAITSYLQETNA